MARSRLSWRDFLKVGGGALAGGYVLGMAGCGGGDGEESDSLGLLIIGNDDAHKSYFADLTAAFQEVSGRQFEPEYVGIEQCHPLHPRATLPHRRPPQRGHKGLAPVLTSIPWKKE